MSIIPSIDRPSTGPNVTEEIQIDGLAYVVEAGEVLHGFNQPRMITTYGFSIDSTSLTNRGTIWSEGINANAAFFWNVENFDNSGLILAEAGAEQAIAIDNPSGTGWLYQNSGTIAAFSEGGAARVLDDWGGTRVVNSGLMAAQSGVAARTLMRWNGGEVVNLAGGQILAEGPEAIAIFFRSYADTASGLDPDPASPIPDVTNEGLIEAASTDPEQASIAIYGYDLIVGRVFDIVNSGTIRADYAIALEPRDDMGPSALVINQAGGLIDGHIALGVTHDRVENAGTVVGDIYLGAGNDLFDGRGGVHTGIVFGEAGNDTLRGGAGADRLYGGDGSDVLDGGAGRDMMYGGAGNDIYHVDHARDVISESGGGGTDTVHAMIDYTLGGDLENLLLEGTAALAGTGNALANTITGNGGANVLDGGHGNDRLVGGAGDDTLIGGLGDDVLSGGPGRDTASYDGLAGAVTVSLAVSGAQDTGAGGIDKLSSIANLVGTRYADTLTGNAGNNMLDGGAGTDTLVGGAGNDTYRADRKADLVIEQAGGGIDTVYAAKSYVLSANVEHLYLEGTADSVGTRNALGNHLVGNLGNNILDGKAGADVMLGGLGDDTYYVDNSGDTVVEADGGGTDAVFSTASFVLVSAVENLTLTGIADVNGTGNALANVLVGNKGKNVLSGGSGDDTLAGGRGADTLFGGKGADVLIGGAGFDVLTGDGGADRFVFEVEADSPVSGRDAITDFSHAQGDLIDLSAIDAVAGGSDEAFTFVNALTGSAGQLVVQTVAADSYRVLGDTNGDGVADFGIDVHSVLALTASDFVL